jgi:hypothetical protein
LPTWAEPGTFGERATRYAAIVGSGAVLGGLVGRPGVGNLMTPGTSILTKAFTTPVNAVARGVGTWAPTLGIVGGLDVGRNAATEWMAPHDSDSTFASRVWARTRVDVEAAGISVFAKPVLPWIAPVYVGSGLDSSLYLNQKQAIEERKRAAEAQKQPPK